MRLMTILPLLLLATPVAAQDVDWQLGPVFDSFGPHVAVEGVDAFAPDTQFSVAFDVAKAAEEGARNRGMESAARFINMHVAKGVAPDNIRAAVVVHGPAVFDLLSAAGWEAHEREDANGSSAMVREMLDHGVRFIVCGQSAAAHGVAKADLIPGVELALSAMTAHAQLQQAGYTVNPF